MPAYTVPHRCRKPVTVAAKRNLDTVRSQHGHDRSLGTIGSDHTPPIPGNEQAMKGAVGVADGQDHAVAAVGAVHRAGTREIARSLARADDPPRIVGRGALFGFDLRQSLVIGALLATAGKHRKKQGSARYPRRHGVRRWLPGA